MIRKSTHLIRSILLFLLVIGIGTRSFSQTHTPRTRTINANCGGYYEYLPYDYDASDQKHPVIFYLHSWAAIGNGSSADLNKVLYEGVPYYINQRQFPLSFTVNDETASFVVISPQFKQWPTASDVKSAIDYILSQSYKIDPSRIYVTGYSMGGDATFKYATSGTEAAGRLAAIATGDPYIYPYSDNGAEYIAKTALPVSAFHSNDDTQAPPMWSVNLVNKINSYNPEVKAKLTLFDGYSHPTAWEKIYNPAWENNGYNLYEWFLNYERSGGGATYNQPPVADAGDDKTIYLPTASVVLDGDNSHDDGQITTYQWKKIAGPSSFTFSNPSAPNPRVSNLVEGIYGFELTVTDNKGAVDKDVVSIQVNRAVSESEPVTSVTRYINVNIYGGSNPYTNTKWNNWNVGTVERTNIGTGTLKYSDGTTSGISALLSHSQSIGDNRDSYKGGMAPAEVLRYTSYSRLPRTLTVSGLSPAKKYTFEVYASRYSIGNSTIFTVNGASEEIAVYNNFTNEALFTNLSPNAQGQLVINLRPGTYYTHLNGFILTEQGTSSINTTNAMAAQSVSGQASILTDEEVSNKASLGVYPNPAYDQLFLRLNNKYTGTIKVRLTDMSGRIRKEFTLVKNQPVFTQRLSVSDLSKGSYIISIQAAGWRASQEIIKL